ncbi:hypothetical protein COCON_G00206410 [Conger conger]|uniref:Uncharacterized protein n=1 Tax=Conger conger TaxID=82655 RepID=A0A9Q1CZN7_CONCO|nr:shiftless antiviral inhibitor of ribosomal frameshifting protein homolog [Conger conger]KAJ8254029.1 hypothetical protein COCON_G00206410 [Conger conger]
MYRQRDEIELEKSVRRLREKFHGKIPIDKATVLMHRYCNNHQLAAKDIILMKDRDLDEEDRRSLTDAAVRNVVARLEAEEKELASHPRPRPQPGPGSGRPIQADREIQDLAAQLKTLPLTQENLRMFDQAQHSHTPSELHQFACQACDTDWWRRVPQRKRVSRCRRCKRKYDPVPAHKMWGIAEFHCLTCQRVFRGFGCMDVGSPCYSCRSLVIPLRILPPRRRQTGVGPGRQNPHSCLAEDCYNRQEPHVPGTECVHPRSRQRNSKPRVVNPSPAHVSTGSTVNTCLSQASILDIDELILEDIKEEEEEEDDEDPRGSYSDSSSN